MSSRVHNLRKMIRNILLEEILGEPDKESPEEDSLEEPDLSREDEREEGDKLKKKKDNSHSPRETKKDVDENSLGGGGMAGHMGGSGNGPGNKPYGKRKRKNGKNAM